MPDQWERYDQTARARRELLARAWDEGRNSRHAALNPYRAHHEPDYAAIAEGHHEDETDQ